MAENCKTDRVEIDLCEFKELTEQSITMLRQVFNNTRDNRLLSVLNALIKKHEYKQMLKENTSIFFQSHKELFGQNFRQDWFTNLKTKQKYQEGLHKETKSTPTAFSRNKPPFRGSPPSLSYGRGGGGHAPQNYLLEQCHKHRGTMFRVIKSPYLNTPQHLDVDRSKVHPLVRTLFHGKARQVPLTGRLKLIQKIGKN